VNHVLNDARLTTFVVAIDKNRLRVITTLRRCRPTPDCGPEIGAEGSPTLPAQIVEKKRLACERRSSVNRDAESK